MVTLLIATLAAGMLSRQTQQKLQMSINLLAKPVTMTLAILPVMKNGKLH